MSTTSSEAEALPEDPAAAEQERRRHPRAPVEAEVHVHFPSVQSFISATVEDLSEGGMLLRGHAGEVGEIVALRLDAGDRRVIEGRARVVRVVPPSGGRSGGIAVEFVELEDLSRRLIAALVGIKLAEAALPPPDPRHR